MNTTEGADRDRTLRELLEQIARRDYKLEEALAEAERLGVQLSEERRRVEELSGRLAEAEQLAIQRGEAVAEMGQRADRAEKRLRSVEQSLGYRTVRRARALVAPQGSRRARLYRRLRSR